MAKKCKWRREEPQSWYSPNCKILIYKKRNAPTHARRGDRWVRQLVARHMPSGREELFTSIKEAKATAFYWMR